MLCNHPAISTVCTLLACAAFSTTTALGAARTQGRALSPAQPQPAAQKLEHGRKVSPDDPAPTGKVEQVEQDGQGGQTPTSITGTLSDVMGKINEQEPIRRAGLRASVLRQAQLTVPVVVVVDDAPSYLLAISSWVGMARFPVLWDDGSAQARQDIARFVRAFRPERVVRVVDDGDYRWSGGPIQKQEAFELALGRALNAQKPDWRASLDELGAQGVVGPGIVVTDVTDTAWPAALALAAGRLQAVGFVSRVSNAWTPMTLEDSDALALDIERIARGTGRSWEGVGDEIDAVTLALNTGTMIQVGTDARSRLATSDRIGRRDSMGGGDRWAWCGQIIGNGPRSAYQAMCALFLTIDQGFVWDGYPQGPPWGAYDGTRAADVLENAGLDVELHDEPRNAIGDWTLRTVRPVGETEHTEPGSGLLMLMNSKGAAHRFDLPGGQGEEGRAGNIPIFEIPAVLHIVHSYSLQRPLDRNTIGGRFLERGVYAYAGSVDEPYLQAFVPTPVIAQRLAGSVAFAAAVRYDDGQVWKIAVLGDPLVTLGKGGRRVDGEVKIGGSVDLDAEAKRLLKDGQFDGAIHDLVLLGRDGDVARLAMALIKDKPADFTPPMALASIPSLYRAGEYAGLLDAYDRLDSAGRADGLMQDLLWLCSPYLLARGNSDVALEARIVGLLRANLRKGQVIDDAETLAMHMRRRSMESALGVLESLRPTLDADQQQVLDQAIGRVRR